MTVSGYVGPHVTWQKWDLNLLGTLSRRWYGDRVYTDTIAGSIDATYFVTPRLGLGGSANLSGMTYAQNAQQSGPGRMVSANAFYTPSTASIIRTSAAFGWQAAHTAAYANHIAQFNLSYTREFGGGITLSLAPSFTRIAYDGPLAGFNNTTRIDQQVSGQVSVLDRKLVWHGLTPRIVYTYTRNRSTVDLYTFNRSRIELGVTRAF